LNITDIQSPADLDAYLDGRDIDLVERKNAPWYHVPIFVFVYLLFKTIGLFKSRAPDPSRYWQTLPCFDGSVNIYFDEKVMPWDSAPTLIHELTHAKQIRDHGALYFALAYTLFPLPIGYTGGATLEWEAQGNVFLWWKNRGVSSLTDKYLRDHAANFCGPKYLWRSFDNEGFYQAWVKLIRHRPDCATEVDYTDIYTGYQL